MQQDDSSNSNTVVDTNNSPDYEHVNIPSKPPSKYSYQERRADLLAQIYDLGHPSMIHQGEAAERYEVSQSQISKDLDRIAESVHEHVVDRDKRAFTVDAVVRRSIRGLLEDGEYRKAAKTAIEWDAWVAEFNDLDDLAERIEQLEREQDTGMDL